MIERLKSKDIREAAKVYNKGLRMEIPKGFSTLNKTIKHLKEVETFVYKKNNKIKGLISFIFKNKNKIKIDFICALEQRKGIGTALMKRLTKFSIRKKIKFIYSNVSSQDKRTIKFYESCGFKRYGKYFADKNFMLFRIKAKPEWILEKIKSKERSLAKHI